MLAAQLVEGEDYHGDADALRAVQNNQESTDRYNVPDYPYLPRTVSRAEVQLFSGENGAIIGNFTFQFDLAGEGTVTVLER